VTVLVPSYKLHVGLEEDSIVHQCLRIVTIVALALVPAACGSGLAGVGGAACRGDGSIVLDPGYYHLVANGDDGNGTATENSANGGSLTETDNCRGVASIGFGFSRGVGYIGVTPLAAGACTMTIDDGPNCVNSSIIVAPAPASSSSTLRRDASPRA
jgi:hypothetical protein